MIMVYSRIIFIIATRMVPLLNHDNIEATWSKKQVPPPAHTDHPPLQKQEQTR